MNLPTRKSVPLPPDVQGSASGLALDRRAFLKLGLTASVALGVASAGASLTGCARREQAAAQGYRFLRDADLALYRALIPVVLADLPLTPELSTATLHSIDDAAVHQTPAVRDKSRSLYDLLHFTPSRWATTGLRAGWDEATPAEIAAFLERWRKSRVALFNTGYNVLTRLICVGYFGQPGGYRAAGYRPLPRVFDALNAGVAP